MALFKILKGNSTNLPTNKVDGYCYVTLDEHKLYVDYKKTDETLDRFALNAVYADTADIANKLSTNAGDANTPIYFSGGIPTACTSLSLNTTGNANTATTLATGRTISISDNSGTNTATGTSFNGSKNITIKLPSIIKASLDGNASSANIAKKLDTDAGDSGTPIYFSSGIPTVCGTLNVNTTGNAATATKASQDAQGNVIHSTYVPFTQAGMTGLFASGVTILSSNQYGSTLPINGVAGQLFFKKI